MNCFVMNHPLITHKVSLLKDKHTGSKDFKSTVKEISMELSQKGPSILLVNKITTSVGNWLVSHIKQQDMKVVAHLQKSQKK